jgi:DNA-binding response OmpR family regulator
MESRGFTVFPAKNGRWALEIFERENISLVLLDLMLPLTERTRGSRRSGSPAKRGRIVYPIR